MRAGFEDECCLRGEAGAGTTRLGVYNADLQMCKWKVGSLLPKAQDMELSRPRVPGGTGFKVSWTTNTSESKPRDPNWPHCAMEASASLWPAGRPEEPGTRANFGRTPQYPAGSKPYQHSAGAAKWPESHSRHLPQGLVSIGFCLSCPES